MGKSIIELCEEIRVGARTSDEEGNVKVNRNFNKAQFNEVMLGLLNDTEYETDVVTKRNDDGTVETKKVNPAKEFRKGTIKPILQSFGVDKEEIKEVENFEIEKVDGLYEVMSEGIELYGRTGKKFNFLPKEDLAASILLDEIEEEIKTYKVPGTDNTVTIQEGKHFKMKVKSTTPTNKKSKL